MMDDILNKPAFTLTTGELIDLVVERIQNNLPKVHKKGEDRKYLHSLGELALSLGCSLTTVNIKKKQGVFGDAIKQNGKMLQIDEELARERFWSSRKRN